MEILEPEDGFNATSRMQVAVKTQRGRRKCVLVKFCFTVTCLCFIFYLVMSVNKLHLGSLYNLPSVKYFTESLTYNEPSGCPPESMPGEWSPGSGVFQKSFIWWGLMMWL